MKASQTKELESVLTDKINLVRSECRVESDKLLAKIGRLKTIVDEMDADRYMKNLEGMREDAKEIHAMYADLVNKFTVVTEVAHYIRSAKIAEPGNIMLRVIRAVDAESPEWWGMRKNFSIAQWLDEFQKTS